MTDHTAQDPQHPLELAPIRRRAQERKAMRVPVGAEPLRDYAKQLERDRDDLLTMIDRIHAERETSPELTGRWLHVKSNRYYDVIGGAAFERDGEPLVIYRSVEDASVVWARPAKEFYDGRFVRQPDEEKTSRIADHVDVVVNVDELPLVKNLRARRAMLEGQQPHRRASEALRYLADHPRPGGGQERFNSEWLYQVADELDELEQLREPPQPTVGRMLEDDQRAGLLKVTTPLAPPKLGDEYRVVATDFHTDQPNTVSFMKIERENKRVEEFPADRLALLYDGNRTYQMFRVPRHDHVAQGPLLVPAFSFVENTFHVVSDFRADAPKRDQGQRELGKDIDYLHGADAHADEGPLGEAAARSILAIALHWSHAYDALTNELRRWPIVGVGTEITPEFLRKLFTMIQATETRCEELGAEIAHLQSQQVDAVEITDGAGHHFTATRFPHDIWRLADGLVVAHVPAQEVVDGHRFDKMHTAAAKARGLLQAIYEARKGMAPTLSGMSKDQLAQVQETCLELEAAFRSPEPAKPAEALDESDPPDEDQPHVTVPALLALAKELRSINEYSRLAAVIEDRFGPPAKAPLAHAPWCNTVVTRRMLPRQACNCPASPHDNDCATKCRQQSMHKHDCDCGQGVTS